MEGEYGSLTIVCKQCKAVYVLQDAGNVERMTGYVCPGCGETMTGRELAWLKGAYYMRLSQGPKKNRLGELVRMFDFDIDLGEHYRR